MKKLHGYLVDGSRLVKNQKDEMYLLMDRHYCNLSRERFEADLEEKQSVILLEDEKQRIRGFTSIAASETEWEGRITGLVFSGDTIVDKSCWGSNEIHKIWARFALGLAAQSDKNYYWLLLSKGYKTYRFLPTYFHDYYPCYKKPMPAFEKRIVDWFGMHKYPDHYRPESGIVALCGERDYLARGIADLTQERLKNPVVRFYAEINPGHTKGDELVCITRLSQDNIKPYVKRHFLGQSDI